YPGHSRTLQSIRADKMTEQHATAILRRRQNLNKAPAQARHPTPICRPVVEVGTNEVWRINIKRDLPFQKVVKNEARVRNFPCYQVRKKPAPIWRDHSVRTQNRMERRIQYRLHRLLRPTGIGDQEEVP